MHLACFFGGEERGLGVYRV